MEVSWHIYRGLYGISMVSTVNINDHFHVTSILAYLVLRQSLTQASMSCLERFSVLAAVAYTLTAIVVC